MKRLASLVVIAACAAMLTARGPAQSAPLPSPAPNASPLGPVEIFRSAMARIRSYPEPAYIDAITLWHVTALGRSKAADDTYSYDVRERIVMRTSDRMEHVIGTVIDKNTRPRYEQLVAPAFFGPDAWAVHGIGHHPPPASNLQPDLPPGVKVIAQVVAYEKIYYTITLAGIDTLGNGRRAYHLLFVPLTEPKRHNLREMWVDVATFDIWQAITTGVYAFPEFGPGPAYVIQQFGPIGKHWLVERATWSYEPPASAWYTYQLDMAYVKLAFPQSVPNDVFAAVPATP